MSKELCFCIENRNLYLEKVLVDYMEVPIFFLCRDEGQYYTALCTDINDFNYIVVRVSKVEVYKLLHGKIPMRNIILNQKEYWEVFSGEEISLDTVKRCMIDGLDITQLPEEGACFKILTEEMEKFVQEYDNVFFDAEYFDETEEEISFGIQIGKSALPVVEIDDVYMPVVNKKAVTFHKSDGSDEWKGELTIGEAA